MLAGHAKLMVTLLQDVQENDQRLTVLQLVDKIKIKHKEVGMFMAWLSISLVLICVDVSVLSDDLLYPRVW